MARFEPVTDLSILSLEGESSLHPIHTSTNKLSGYFEIGIIEPGKFDLSTPASGSFEVFVEDLKSDFSYLDRVVQDRLDIRRFPRIRATLKQVREVGNGTYVAAGDITFHGETRPVEKDIDISWLDDSTIEVKGEMQLNVGEFNIQSPKLVSITVEPEVTVRLKLVLKQVNP